MKNAKIHIAGPLVGSVQKCVRCHTRIDSNRAWAASGLAVDREPTGWREGSEMFATRYGASSEVKNPQDYRACGKAAA
jgi:hypothetical protein